MISHIYYSRDTNLLFSAGDDGNLFIYAIYEYPDGETAVFEDNKNTAIAQLNSILDEGLGDNVLISLYEIGSMNDNITQLKDKIFSLIKSGDENAKNYEKMLKDTKQDDKSKKPDDKEAEGEAKDSAAEAPKEEKEAIIMKKGDYTVHVLIEEVKNCKHAQNNSNRKNCNKTKNCQYSQYNSTNKKCCLFVLGRHLDTLLRDLPF